MLQNFLVEKHMDNLLVSLWQTEYSKGGITSSVRQGPSGAVKRLVELLGTEKIASSKGVDVGCGTGRNAIFLSELGCEILAIDFVTDMINSLELRKHTMSINNLSTMVVDLTKKWTLPSCDYNLFIDTHCFFHIIHLEGRLNYKAELIKHAAADAIFLLTFTSPEDGYYSNHIIREDNSLQVALDPGNNIECVLYMPDQIINFFSPEFKIIDLREDIQTNSMHGATYRRKGYQCLFSL